MHQPVKFLRFAAATLLFPLSAPRLVFASTVTTVVSESKTQIIQSPEAELEQILREGVQQFANGQLLVAKHTFEQALEIYRQAGYSSSKDVNIRVKEIEILGHLAEVYTSLGDSSKVIKVSKVALEIAREIENRDTELKLLMALGDAYNSLGQYEQAIKSATASLALAQTLKNYQAQAVAFITLARAYQYLAYNNSDNNEAQKATESAISGLTLAWKIKDQDSEAKALSILGSIYNTIGKNRDAIIFSRDALKVAKKNDIPSVTASSLLTLASVRLKQGEYLQAIEAAKEGKNYLQKLQQREAEGATSVLLGLAYLGEGNSQKSLSFAEQGLAISREVKSPLVEALALIVLSLDYSHSGNSQKAFDLLAQSRVIAKGQNNRDLEALILEVRGAIYKKLGEKEQAVASYQQALSIKDTYSAKAGLARIYEELNLVGAAITYYKQAINKNEDHSRRWIPGLPIWLEESFVQAVEDMNGVRIANSYRTLVNLLLSQRRVAEAQQVLELLKGQELREYTGSAQTNGQLTRLTITPTEEQILKQYGSIIAFGYRLDECKQTRCVQLEELAQKRSILNKQYYESLAKIEAKLRDRAASDEAFVDPSQFALKAQKIVESQPDTILIYPLVLEDKVWLLWASKGGIFKSMEVSGVSQKQMEETVLKFRRLLQNRLSNVNEVKSTGKQLYDWLLKPLEKELKANNIHNLVFSLDRSTRYIPMGVLFDGEKYLIENYTVSTVLSTNLTNLRSTANEGKVTKIASASQISAVSDNQDLTVLALGVSDGIAGFKPLPNVPGELNAIVRQNVAETQGVFPGEEFLNKSFDFFSLRDNLHNHQIVHIATHSKFVPGQVYKSYILLGSGEKLEIPDIETWLNLRNINLVVLSACETALGGPGLDGKEIAGIGYYFLKGGAKTVIASLWNVDDRSTRLLMEQFYDKLAQGTPTSPVQKAQALRQAQLTLLNGSSTTVKQQGVGRPSSVKKSPFRHPYYWSSFILMGSGL